MKTYEISMKAETVYTIEAENEEEALDRAFEYWEYYEPSYEIKKIKVN